MSVQRHDGPPRTPEEFLERNPNWKADAATMIGHVLLKMIQDGFDPELWSDETIAEISQNATTTVLDVFSPHRALMGDQLFGELVLFVGEQTRRMALMARDGAPEGPEALQ